MTQNLVVPAGDGHSRDLALEVPDGLPMETVRTQIIPAVIALARTTTAGVTELVQLKNDMVAVIEFSNKEHQVKVREIIPIMARTTAYQNALDDIRKAPLDDDIRESALEALRRAYQVKSWLGPGRPPADIAAALHRDLLDIYATAADFIWELRTWVLEIAPIVLAAHAKQILRDVVREFPFISGAAEEGVLQWLKEHGM
jgi:hypothetical protein